MKYLMVLINVLCISMFFITAAYSGDEPVSIDVQSVLKQPVPKAKPQVRYDIGNVPLYFTANSGQVHQEARFYSRASRYTLWLTKKGLIFDSFKNKTGNDAGGFDRDVSRLMFVGARSNPQMTLLSPKALKINYFKGNDPAKWNSGVPTSGAVQYKRLYKNIDLKVYGVEKQIEYDFIVKAGGDPGLIKFKYHNVKGTRIDNAGNLMIETQFGELMHKRPFSYQEENGRRKEVASSFKKIAKNTYGFSVGDYDRNRELVIDPVVLAYSSYLGGSGNDYSGGIALDGSGNMCIAGTTVSSNFPVSNAYSTSPVKEDVFVSRLSATGDLLYSTYLGGDLNDQMNAMTIDADGIIYVTGRTWSNNFPTAAQYRSDMGDVDAFVVKIDPTKAGTASLLYSTYLGGNRYDQGLDIFVDAADMVYVIGRTDSSDLPTTPNKIQSYAGLFDAFVIKLNPFLGPDGLLYGTFLGGSNNEFGLGIVVDAAGDIYVCGATLSSNFPVKNPIQAYQGEYDGFAAKLSPESGLIYSTTLGTVAREWFYGLDIDAAGHAYVAGVSGGAGFPTQNPLYDYQGGNGDGVVFKLAPDGSSLVFSTYIGGTGYDLLGAIKLDASGNIYLCGESNSSNFPTVDPYQGHQGGRDAVVLKLSADGSAITFSSYFGSSGDDVGTGLVVDAAENIYFTGYTYGSDLPVENEYQGSNHGNMDAFLAKLSFDVPATLPIEERNSLNDFYDATIGPGWLNNTNWLGDYGTEDDWFGVTVQTIYDVPRVTHVILNFNNLTGSFPATVPNWPLLRYFHLKGNSIGGGIPAWMGDLSQLEQLDLSNNADLGGSIPAELGNLGNLNSLNLSGCGLSGVIPAELAAVASLEQLSLANNDLSGDIPDLSALTNLWNLNLGNNGLTGSLPDWIGNMTALKYLKLYFNAGLTGPVPDSILNLNNLKTLDIRFTGLTLSQTLEDALVAKGVTIKQ